MKETRYTCPLCKIPSFTLTDAGGGGALSKHYCRAKNWAKLTPAECRRAVRSPEEFQMTKKSPAQTSALVILQDKSNLHGVQISKLQAIVTQQFDMVKALERDAALRAILVGLILHRIKAGLKHGEFMPWLKKNITGTGYRQCAYYMKLGSVFVEETRLTKDELLALPGDKTDLAVIPADAEARRFMEKARKFVGELSLSELLDEHNLKEKKKLGGAHGQGEGDEKIDPERLSEMKREEASECLQRAEQLFVDENIFQHLKHEERKVVVEKLESITSKARAALKTQSAS